MPFAKPTFGAAFALIVASFSVSTVVSRAAISADMAALEAAAKKEGTLTWYTSEVSANVKRTTEAFEKRFGIKTNIFRATGSELQQRYSAERASGQVIADVISIASTPFLDDGLGKGWFMKLSSKVLPELASWPVEYKTEGYITFYVEPLVLEYNTDLVKPEDVPNKWTDLLNDKNKGRLLALDPRASTSYLDEYNVWRTKIGDDFLRGLAAAKPALVQSATPGGQTLAAGEKAFLFPTVHSHASPLIAKGAPIAIKILSPTTGVSSNFAISEGSAHPNAAKLFVNWALSAEGEKMTLDESKVSPRNIESTKLLPKEFIRPDVAGAALHRAEVLKLLELER